jgi:ribosomal protein S12 methylthiotransferase accessory factor
MDPGRLSPMMAGSCRLEGTLLVVRNATQDVEVQAPKAMLAQVFNLCDGTRTVNEILQRLPTGSDAEEFRQFIEFLLNQGALIDANLVSAHAARYAFQGSPFGLSADAVVTNQICRRFLWNKEGAAAGLPPGTRKVTAMPLRDFFAERVSTYTFAEKDISERALLGLLWSVAGVVCVKHERVGYVTPKRTIASAGGMQLVQVFVALQKSVGSYDPGIYRVSYPDEGAVALELLGDGQQLMPRAFSKPWELTYATGAVFLAADPQVAAMRYRNRSLQYLFMEAGAGLHNAGLSASQLGLGFATIGGYYETIVGKMCRLQGELVLGSAIFGPKPTPEQIRLIDRSPELDFAWVDSDSARFAMPFHFGRAKLVKSDDNRPHTWGRDIDPWLALRKASAEAVEREGFREPRQLTWGRLDSLSNGLDPTHCVKYAEKQYADPEFPYERFDAQVPHLWTAGLNLRSGETVQILAELVFSRASLTPHAKIQRRPFSQVTSSGCAASTSMDDAVFRALLEVIERDAFMRHWLAQSPGHVVTQSSLSLQVRSRIQALEQAGCKVVIQKLDSPWAHVCLVAAQNETLHFTTMGTAASADFRKALEGALDETEARVYAWIHGHEPQITGPADVATTDHHFELYGLKRYFRHANRVLFPDADAIDMRIAPFQFKTAAQMIKRFAARGLSPVMVDITPKHCFVDQGRTPLSVVKVLVPGLLPISFGHQREPLGMVPRVHPGSKFPHPFP